MCCDAEAVRGFVKMIRLSAGQKVTGFYARKARINDSGKRKQSQVLRGAAATSHNHKSNADRVIPYGVVAQK